MKVLKRKTSAPALDRSVLILNYVSECVQPPTAALITRDLALPKSSAHGLINALVAHGLLYKDHESRYSISGHIMQWANAFLSQQNVVKLFHSEIVTVAELSHYNLTLTCRDDRDVLCLACHNGDAKLGFTFHMGLRLPIGFAATGKAMLSTESDAAVIQLLGNQWHEPMTEHSADNCDLLLAELHKTRQRGYSIDDREVRDGMYCIGVPIFDHSQCAVYGIALSMQKSDAKPEDIQTIGTLLREGAAKLSRRLGYVPA